MRRVQLSHGGGGEQTNALIKELFFKHLGNEILEKMEDAAVVEVGQKIAFTTDSFVVTPLFFNGGDIGKLSIVGTVNDLVMMGAKPQYLTCGFIIEEGFLIDELETIVKSMSSELEKCGAKIVAGDTKVVPKGSVDGLFINTSGVGTVVCEDISCKNLNPSHVVIVSNEIGNHGATILATREEIDLNMNLKSDCASLVAPVHALFDEGIKPIALRDATRGGLSAVLNEWATSSHVGVLIDEQKVPMADEVKGVCEMFGFEPYEFANEGTMVLCVESKDVTKTLEVLRRFETTKHASAIGEVVSEYEGKVVLKNAWGTKRYLEAPKGELLPRIC